MSVIKGATSHATYNAPGSTMPKPPVAKQHAIYSDRYFKFGQCLVGIVYPAPCIASYIAISLPMIKIKNSLAQKDYMPIFNALRLKYGTFPGIGVFENQFHFSGFKQEIDRTPEWEKTLPIIRCIVPNDTLDGDIFKGSQYTYGNKYKYELLPLESQVTNIVHRDSRFKLSRIPVASTKTFLELERKSLASRTPSPAASIEIFRKSLTSRTPSPAASIEIFRNKDIAITIQNDEENPLLPFTVQSPYIRGSSPKKEMMSTDRLSEDYRKGSETPLSYHSPADSRKGTSSRSSSSYSISTSSSKPKSKGFQILETSDYEILPDADQYELSKGSTLAMSEMMISKGNCMEKLLAGQDRKYSGSPGLSSAVKIQDSSFSSIEPYPLPEAPSLLLLEPLLLMQHDITEDNHRGAPKKRKRRKEQLTRSEQQKVARIMIGYTLAFFLLAIVTFYVVYFV